MKTYWKSDICDCNIAIYSNKIVAEKKCETHKNMTANTIKNAIITEQRKRSADFEKEIEQENYGEKI